jgi:hypothetical protein
MKRVEAARLAERLTRFVEASELDGSGCALNTPIGPALPHSVLEALPLRRRDVLGSSRGVADRHTSLRHGTRSHAKDVLRCGGSD